MPSFFLSAALILGPLKFFRRWLKISFTELRINKRIPPRDVRVIDVNGGSLGVFSRDEALKMADDRGVDLVEMSPNAKPPVCKLIDYGKYKYEQTKKDKAAKKKQHTIVVKEIQVRPNIDPHDFKIKLNHALEFLGKGYKVKFVIRFRGRELEYRKKRGDDMKGRIIDYVSEKGEMEGKPSEEMRTVTFVVAPYKK